MHGRFLGTVAVLSLAALAAMSTAAAHVHVCISDAGKAETLAPGHHCDDHAKYEVVVGWLDEPPVAGMANGLDLRVTQLKAAAHGSGNGTGHNDTGGDHHGGSGVTNITTLTARYEFGGRNFPLELRPAFGKPGHYLDEVIPTRPGTYTLRFGGSIHGTPVDFTVEPQTVVAANDLAFPEALPDVAALQQKVTALEAEVAALKANPQRNSAVNVDPKGAPGFEPLVVLAALGAALLAVRRRA